MSLVGCWASVQRWRETPVALAQPGRPPSTGQVTSSHIPIRVGRRFGTEGMLRLLLMLAEEGQYRLRDLGEITLHPSELSDGRLLSNARRTSPLVPGRGNGEIYNVRRYPDGSTLGMMPDNGPQAIRRQKNCLASLTCLMASARWGLLTTYHRGPPSPRARAGANLAP